MGARGSPLARVLLLVWELGMRGRIFTFLVFTTGGVLRALAFGFSS